MRSQWSRMKQVMPPLPSSRHRDLLVPARPGAGWGALLAWESRPGGAGGSCSGRPANRNGEAEAAKPERGSAGLALCTRARCECPRPAAPNLNTAPYSSKVAGLGGCSGSGTVTFARHLSTRASDAGPRKVHRPHARRVTWAGRARAPAPSRGGGDGGRGRRRGLP